MPNEALINKIIIRVCDLRQQIAEVDCAVIRMRCAVAEMREWGIEAPESIDAKEREGLAMAEQNRAAFERILDVNLKLLASVRAAPHDLPDFIDAAPDIELPAPFVPPFGLDFRA